MGNAHGLQDVVEEDELPSNTPHYIIHFHSCSNVPMSDYTTEIKPYLRSYIGIKVDNGFDYNLEKISMMVTTSEKGSKNPIWHSYRDFYISPPVDAVLVVEVVNAKFDSGETDVLGYVEIPLSDLTTQNTITIPFSHQKVRFISPPF